MKSSASLQELLAEKHTDAQCQKIPYLDGHIHYHLLITGACPDGLITCAGG